MHQKLKLLIFPILAVMIGITIYILFLNKEQKVKEPKIGPPKVINEIKDYGYKLDENKGERYKNLFIELKTELEKETIDKENYAKLISKLFVIDFYTLKDKITKNDVGGTLFIHEAIRENFIEQAKDTIYKYIENNVYGDRMQKLPKVISVEVLEVKQKSFTYLNKKDPKAYEVSLSWTYEEDLGYETSTKIILVHEENKLAIVQMD